MNALLKTLPARVAIVAATGAVGFLSGWSGHDVTTGIAFGAALCGAAIAAVFGVSDGRCGSLLRRRNVQR